MLEESIKIINLQLKFIIKIINWDVKDLLPNWIGGVVDNASFTILPTTRYTNNFYIRIGGAITKPRVGLHEILGTDKIDSCNTIKFTKINFTSNFAGTLSNGINLFRSR